MRPRKLIALFIAIILNTTVTLNPLAAGNQLNGNRLLRLSDIHGRHLAFTESGETGDRIHIYDIETQAVTVIRGDRNSNPAIGANVIAYMQSRSFDIPLYDLNTGTVSNSRTTP